ncbi:MAG: hypothetical protein ACI8PT_004696, partial [Gammaproteobacteria bacterium]
MNQESFDSKPSAMSATDLYRWVVSAGVFRVGVFVAVGLMLVEGLAALSLPLVAGELTRGFFGESTTSTGAALGLMAGLLVGQALLVMVAQYLQGAVLEDVVSGLR